VDLSSDGCLEVLGMGPEFKGSDNSIMLRHIREKFATHTVRVSRAKIMLVGSGLVGKTTLVHRLACGEFVQTQGHTDGVLMSTLQLGELGDIEAAVLDFGELCFLGVVDNRIGQDRVTYV
jgi:hypothetical protein